MTLGTGDNLSLGGSAGLDPANNLSDLTNAATARVNLGISTLGSALIDDTSVGAMYATLGITTVASALFDDTSTGAMQATLGLNSLKQTLWIPAGSIRPSASGGCAPLAVVATSANHPDLTYLAFDATTQEYAQFTIAMPKGWNESTVTFQAVWTHPATATNFGVVWDLQGVAVSDDDAIDVAYGTAQTSTDTGGTTSDTYISPESSAITLAGTPAEGDVAHFRISRVTGDGSDTMTVDAYLLGIKLYYTINTLTDA